LRINTFKETSPGLVIENCKALIESIFKTIIVEVDSKTEGDLKNCDIGNLFRQVKKLLQFDEKGYCNIIGSFSNAIGEFRNKLGEVFHGKDIYTLESNQTSLFIDELNFLLNSTDNIAYFLLCFYTNLYPIYAEKKKVLLYEDNMEFNDLFDETEGEINLGGVSLIPSRVLFDGDIEAYKAKLADYSGKNDLIERLKISPNFASTHSLIQKLSEDQNFSKGQIIKLFDVFFENNQIHWIAKDDDIESFYTNIIDENQELFDDDALAAFCSYFVEEGELQNGFSSY